MIRSLNGKTPKVHPTAFVSEAAYVVGAVEIGENSGIWPGTVIRGDASRITIGKNTNIQDNCVIHADQDARIVADNCLLGNGCTVNDGAEIGEFSVVASGAVVLEDTKIPPGSLVGGIPATVKGRSADRHRELILSTARQYKGAGLE